MTEFTWDAGNQARFEAVKSSLAEVSTASACQMLISSGWRNTHMLGIRPLQQLGLGSRVVGRARTCRYLMRREPESPIDPEVRRKSPEIQLIESIDEGDIFCVDALGLPTAGIIGDILATRLKFRGAAAAIINGAVRDAPYLRTVGLPVFSSSTHPAHSGRDFVPIDFDRPINMAGVQVISGDIILADDEGAIAMPLELAEFVAEHGPHKERLEAWIRGKISAGRSVHDYYPPTPEKLAEYEGESTRS
jgi:regulator of RNase E activity RraA